MGLLIIVAALVSFAAFALTPRWKLSNRVALAAAIFILFAVAPIVYVIAIGDQPSEGSRTWTPDDSAAPRAEQSHGTQPPTVAPEPVSSLAAGNIDDPVYEVVGDVEPPVMIGRCEPQVPDSIEGREIVQPLFIYETVISAEGKVIELQLKSPAREGALYDQLEKSFRAAILNCLFEPATLHGRPVAVRSVLVTRMEVR